MGIQRCVSFVETSTVEQGVWKCSGKELVLVNICLGGDAMSGCGSDRNSFHDPPGSTNVVGSEVVVET